MHYHQNHMWCTRSNWDDKHFDTSYMICIDEYERRDAFPSYTIPDEDWINLIEFIPEVWIQEEYDRQIEYFKKYNIENPDRPREWDEMIAKGYATKLNVPKLKQEVIDWLNENVKDNPKPYDQCAKGWCMGNDDYRANDRSNLALFFHRRSEAMAFVKRWSVHKKPTTYLDYFKDIRKELIDGKLIKVER